MGGPTGSIPSAGIVVGEEDMVLDPTVGAPCNAEPRISGGPFGGGFGGTSA